MRLDKLLEEAQRNASRTLDSLDAMMAKPRRQDSLKTVFVNAYVVRAFWRRPARKKKDAKVIPFKVAR